MMSSSVGINRYGHSAEIETTPLIILPLKRPIPTSRWERRKNAYLVTLVYLTAMIAMVNQLFSMLSSRDV